MKNYFRGCTHPASLNTSEAQEAAQRKQREALSPGDFGGETPMAVLLVTPLVCRQAPNPGKNLPV